VNEKRSTHFGEIGKRNRRSGSNEKQDRSNVDQMVERYFELWDPSEISEEVEIEKMEDVKLGGQWLLGERRDSTSRRGGGGGGTANRTTKINFNAKPVTPEYGTTLILPILGKAE
jgi:hypothetical protein